MRIIRKQKQKWPCGSEQKVADKAAQSQLHSVEEQSLVHAFFKMIFS